MTGESSKPSGYDTKLELIRTELNAQGRRVFDICEAAFEAFFNNDPEAGKRAAAMDDQIDRVDVAVEQQAVGLLCEVAREANELPPRAIRELLVIVKANNELERIADCAVHISEHVAKRAGAEVPETFRVLCNSVIGIVRDVCKSLEQRDAERAKVALRAEDTVRGFKAAVLRDAEQRIASGAMTVDTAFLLHEIASCCEHIADHSTNIAEQVLYAVTGTIVRHCEAGWIEVNL